jgi:hypothetical protein
MQALLVRLLDADNGHTFNAPDPAILVAFDGDEVPGRYIITGISRRDNPLAFQNEKDDIVRFRMGRYLLAVIKADQNRVESSRFDEVFFHMTFWRELCEFVQIDMPVLFMNHYHPSVLRYNDSDNVFFIQIVTYYPLVSIKITK